MAQRWRRDVFRPVEMAKSAPESLGLGGRAPRGSDLPVRPGASTRKGGAWESLSAMGAADSPVSEAIGEKSFQRTDASAARTSTACCAWVVKPQFHVASAGGKARLPGDPHPSIQPACWPTDGGIGSWVPAALAARRYFSSLLKGSTVDLAGQVHAGRIEVCGAWWRGRGTWDAGVRSAHPGVAHGFKGDEWYL